MDDVDYIILQEPQGCAPSASEGFGVLPRARLLHLYESPEVGRETRFPSGVSERREVPHQASSSLNQSFMATSRGWYRRAMAMLSLAVRLAL